MKTYGILCFVLALFMILTPLLSLDYSSFSLSNVKSTFQKENDREDEEKLLDEKSDSVKIKSAASGNVATASTKEYIIGCVAAEMPATYSTEALKAQAVCAYTNLVRLKKNPDSSLSGADISDDPGRHQGYYDTETQKEKWGDKYDEYRAKTEEAVTDVLGKTIVFNGEPIVAGCLPMNLNCIVPFRHRTQFHPAEPRVPKIYGAEKSNISSRSQVPATSSRRTA